MKTSYKHLELMLLRPLIHNGEEVELTLRFNDTGAYRTNISEAIAIGMTPGDTVSIRAKACCDTTDSYKYITVYMSEDMLTQFFTRYGFSGITADISAKLKFMYVICNSDDPYRDELKEEIIAFRLLEIL